MAGSAACASTENPQPVLVINGGTAGVGGDTSGGTGGSTGGVGAQAGSGASGGTTGGTGAVAGSDAGGSAGMTSGGAGGAGGSAGTTGGSAGTGATGGSAGTGAAGTGGSTTGGTGATGGSAGSTTGGTGGGGAVNLYFSEYIEGSGSLNKAVEIYNAGGTTSLNGCVVNLYSNGTTSVSQSENLTGTLLAGDVITLCVSDSTNSKCNIAPTLAVNFSGNDVVELRCNSQLMDIIGKLGEAPSSGWSGGGVATFDATLRRKCTVNIGDRNPSDAFDPSVEWVASGSVNDYSDFGQYACP